MAKLLALEWGLREARVAVARTQGGSVVVEHAFAVDLGPRDPGQTFSDESVGSKVAQASLAARALQDRYDWHHSSVATGRLLSAMMKA